MRCSYWVLNLGSRTIVTEGSDCRTRQILNLNGELDGQQLPSRQAFAAVEAADNAARLGLNHVAAFQPGIFIPGWVFYHPGRIPYYSKNSISAVLLITGLCRCGGCRRCSTAETEPSGSVPACHLHSR